MKNKYIITVFIVGSLIVIIGALFKILHFEFGPVTGNVMLTIGILTEAFAGVILLLKLLSNKNNEFLNK